MSRGIRVLAVLGALAGGCMAAGEETDDELGLSQQEALPPPGGGGGTMAPPPNPCLTAAADDTGNIPESGTVNVRSGDGSYAYDANGCSYYIADLRQYVYSNAYWDGDEWINFAIEHGAQPFDLPSSSAYGNIVPTTQRDCQTINVSIKLHTRHSYVATFPSSPSFTATVTGTWNAGSQTCTMNWPNWPQHEPPNGGVYIHRWLVKVMLRGTAQQAEAWAEPTPPE